MTSWIDPATGSRRLLLTSADPGLAEASEGIVLHSTNATVTTVDYAARTVTTDREAAGAIQSAARLGVNVPSPRRVRLRLRSATLVGEARPTSTATTRPSADHRATEVAALVPRRRRQLYVDIVYLPAGPRHDQPAREAARQTGPDLDTTRRADLSQTAAAIPSGFTGHGKKVVDDTAIQAAIGSRSTGFVRMLRSRCRQYVSDRINRALICLFARPVGDRAQFSVSAAQRPEIVDLHRPRPARQAAGLTILVVKVNRPTW